MIPSVHDRMMFFAVQDNTLDWRIPESINNLINLAHLDISANNMVIPFPSTMNQLSNLRSLYTGINPFGEHPIPSFLEGMTNLKELSMKQNKVTGTVPAFLGGLTNLQVLDLDFNQLEGSIPSVSESIAMIDLLDIREKVVIYISSQNVLFSYISFHIISNQELGSLTGIDTLMLNRNYLNGTLPDSFSLLEDVGMFLLMTSLLVVTLILL